MILSDSIAKNVSGVHGARVVAFPGITIGRLSAKVQKMPNLIEARNTVLHVGTNDINNLSASEMISEYNNLITAVQTLSKTKILISSILPRPVDYSLTKEKVKEVNRLLKCLCADRKVSFLHSFRPFFKGGQPVRELFATRDGGLHLNLEGTRRLKLFFINTVNHL